jgi:hypothetical protein
MRELFTHFPYSHSHRHIVIILILENDGEDTLEPHFSFFFSDNNPSAVVTSGTNSTTSDFVGFDKTGDLGHWLKAFERSFADFLPLLSLGGETEVGIIDYIMKVFGSGLTFVLLAIALRR